MTLVAIPAALVVGLVIGALGGGGAIITVPALVHLLGQDPHRAMTSSLLIVGVTAVTALAPHARRGNIRVGQGLTFALLGIAGSVAGSALSARVGSDVLLLLFSALMLVVATLMLLKARQPLDASDGSPPEPMLSLRPFSCACPRVARLLATATGVGFLTGLLGVGGGFVLVPALVLVLALPMPAAVGTSLLVIAVNSTVAFTARLVMTPEPVDWPLVATFTTVAVLGSLAGARVARRLPVRAQTMAFAGLLVVVATYTAAGALT